MKATSLSTIDCFAIPRNRSVEVRGQQIEVTCLERLRGDGDLETYNLSAKIYSRFKFGCRWACHFLAKRLRDCMISGLRAPSINKRSCIVIPDLAVGAPVEHLGEMLARLLNIPLVRIQCSSANSGNVIYGRLNTLQDRLRNRQKNEILIDNVPWEKDLIFLDDCVTTGATTYLIKEMLASRRGKEINFITVYSVECLPSFEDCLNDYFIRGDAVGRLSRLLNEKCVWPTRNTVQAVESLSESDCHQLKGSLSAESRSRLAAERDRIFP